MKKEHAERFSEEMERYRRALVFFARQCDWDAFKSRAERLFEYVETVESIERERSFYRIFNSILAVLVAGVTVLFIVDPQATGVLAEHRQTAVVLSLIVSGFELCFYVNFRKYVAVRMADFQERRAAFLRNIERDFRTFTARPGEERA